MSGSDAFYRQMKGVASDLLSRFKQGDVRLLRDTRAAVDPTKPHLPGAVSSTAEHVLDATVRVVSEEHLLNTSVVASDLSVIFAARSSLTESLEVQMTDRIKFDGKERVIKNIIRKPGTGIAVAFDVAVAS